MNSKMYAELLKALESGAYDAPPAKVMRDGSVFPIDGNLTEHQYDVIWTQCLGYPGYREYPHPLMPRTPEEIQEVVDAAHEYALRNYDTRKG